MVEGIAGGGEKEVAQPSVGMTYLRNQVYVGRRSIVPVRCRAGLPPVAAAATAAAAVVLSTVFVVGAAGEYPDARVPRARTGSDPRSIYTFFPPTIYTRVTRIRNGCKADTRDAWPSRGPPTNFPQSYFISRHNEERRKLSRGTGAIIRPPATPGTLISRGGHARGRWNECLEPANNSCFQRAAHRGAKDTESRGKQAQGRRTGHIQAVAGSTVTPLALPDSASASLCVRRSRCTTRRGGETH